MGIEVITKFNQIDTVKVWAYVYDETGALVDPTGSISIDIYDPNGALKVDGAAMTKSATGIYYYYYHQDVSADPMAKGKWRGTVTEVDGTGVTAIVSSEDFSFEVN